MRFSFKLVVVVYAAASPISGTTHRAGLGPSPRVHDTQDHLFGKRVNVVHLADTKGEGSFYSVYTSQNLGNQLFTGN